MGRPSGRRRRASMARTQLASTSLAACSGVSPSRATSRLADEVSQATERRERAEPLRGAGLRHQCEGTWLVRADLSDQAVVRLRRSARRDSTTSSTTAWRCSNTIAPT